MRVEPYLKMCRRIAYEIFCDQILQELQISWKDLQRRGQSDGFEFIETGKDARRLLAYELGE